MCKHLISYFLNIVFIYRDGKSVQLRNGIIDKANLADSGVVGADTGSPNPFSTASSNILFMIG